MNNSCVVEGAFPDARDSDSCLDGGGALRHVCEDAEEVPTVGGLKDGRFAALCINCLAVGSNGRSRCLATANTFLPVEGMKATATVQGGGGAPW